VEALHAELHAKPYPYLNPGIEPRGGGREMILLDPASNEIRFSSPHHAGPDPRATLAWASEQE
jgi:hypothetical protein